MVVDDEAHILELIQFNLENAGFRVVTASSGEEGLEKIKNEIPDLLLLDVMLPGIDGLEVCKRLKSGGKTSSLPIIMLTAKSEEVDKVLGLELGADDYITKPFSVRELIARVKALLRRSGPSASAEADSERILVGNLNIDTANYEVYSKGVKLDLTLKEFELLKMLVQNKGKVLTRDSLLDKVWGYEYYGETRTVDVHIRHLRKKLGEEDGSCIETIRGVGYRFQPKEV
jgi:two-component system alkaline phosphatase synthesis response regulator PhoP